MNHFAYYALKCEGGDFASCNPVEGCSFAGGGAFTFGMDFYWSGQTGILFQQEGRVCPALSRPDAHYAPFFAALRKAGYDARISCEAYSHQGLRQDMACAIEFLRAMTK